MLTRLAQRKNRFIHSDNIAFAILPLVLLPLLPQVWLLYAHQNKEIK